MAQPTGPHPTEEAEMLPPSPAVRAAAGRDMSFSTRRLPQARQRTSDSSDRRRTSSSKERPQALHVYS